MAVTIESALELIYNNTPIKQTKILPIESALGLVLAQDIVATHNLPPYDNSAMDGYAVKVEDSNSEVKITHTILAGDNSNEVLLSKNAFKIMTGAKIPRGCEAIVPTEDTTAIEGFIKLPSDLKHGRHIRLCGEDIKCGDTLLHKGDKLQAHQITLLASQGISHVLVHKKPHISIFASGSELKMHFEQVEDSYQLYNTNAPALKARCEELGCDVDFIGTAKDTFENMQEHLRSALDSDLIITSGGVSVGDADYTKKVFDSFGMETFFDKVEIKPGKPTTFGRIGNSMVLNLPGNPLAASINFELFGQSILLAMSGVNEKYLNTIDAKMAKECKLKAGRRTLVPGFFNGSSFEVMDKFAPGMVRPLSSSNAYIMIDESCSLIKKDSIVKVLPIRFAFNSKEQKCLATS